MSERQCAVCGGAFTNTNPVHVTCGHPRCVRTNRARKKNNWRLVNGKPRKSTRILPEWDAPNLMAPDLMGASAIVTVWDANAQREYWDRLATVARHTKEPVRVVISTLRAKGRLG